MRKINRREALIGSTAIATSILTRRLARAAEPSIIKFVGSAPSPTPALAYFYLGKPHFDQPLGIQSDFSTVAGGVLSLQLISSGQGTIGTVPPLDLVAAKQKQPDLPARAVYLQDVTSGFDLVVPAASAVTTIAGLKEKTIGVQNLSSGTVAHSKALLRRGGVDPKTVQFLPVGVGPQAAAAVKSGQVDAICLQTTQIAGLENLGMEFRQFPSPKVSTTSIVASEDTIKNRREELIKALQCVALNSAFAETNPTATVYDYWNMFGKPPGDTDKALHDARRLVERNAAIWKPLRDPRPWGAIGDEDFRAAIDFLGPDSGIQMDSLDYANFYTAEFIPAVNEVDISIATNAAKAWKAPT